MNTIVEEIEKLVIDGDIKTCLNNLRDVLSISNSELLNDVIIISSELNKLESDKRKGILNYSEESIQTNKINNRILSVLDVIKENGEIINQFIQTDAKINKANKELGFKTNSWMKSSLIKRIARLKEDKLERDITILWIGKKKTSGLSSHNFRVEVFQFSTGISDFHLPIHSTLCLIDVHRPSLNFLLKIIKLTDTSVIKALTG